MATKDGIISVINALAEDTKIPMCSFKLKDEKADIFSSKVGGLAYAPHDIDFPKDKKGRGLSLLAQIKCSDVDLEDFPKSGILQLWILNDDLSGVDFEDQTNQDGFRVIYYKDIDMTITESEVKAKYKPYEDDYSPVNGEYSLAFEKSSDSLSTNVATEYNNIEELFVKKYNLLFPNEQIESFEDLGELEDVVWDWELVNNFGHKIGGYPAFTQYEVRSKGDTHDFLLFQLDSDYEGGATRVMWGDSGICNFFISRENLKKLDFSDVLYNWDCM